MSTPERFEFRSDDGLSIAYVKGETAATFVESFKSLTDLANTLVVMPNWLRHWPTRNSLFTEMIIAVMD